MIKSLSIKISFILCFIINLAYAQDNNQYRIIQITTQIQKNPLALKFTWPAIDKGTKITIFRKSKDATNWDLNSPLATLAGSATSYSDNTIILGQDYEYFFRGYGTDVNPYTYIYGGVEVAEVDNRGKIILIVDDRFSSSLEVELKRFENDLEGDGWQVIRHDVASSASVVSVKELIKTDYALDPVNTKSVFLFGHVPVPYTGNIAWDGHGDHNGAWPCDGYYADMTGVWTDNTVVSTQASRVENRNIIGDGKFDQSYFPALTTLQIGRVDLSNMPDFKETEEFLLRRYLNRNHDYRHKLFTAEQRALIDNNFGLDGFDSSFYASCGWRSFNAMYNPSKITNADYFTKGKIESYLWAYGAGGGTYTSAWGVGSSVNFYDTPPKIVFNMLFGSYFGDWDSKNNFLRAPLASPGWGLASCWAGRPYWLNHHLSLGETLGYSTWITMRNTCYQSDGPNFNRTSINLMGDPTLRMHVVQPPKHLQVLGNVLTWEESIEASSGYAIYRKNNETGKFEKITQVNTGTLSYIDETAPTGINYYMVKSLNITESNSGSYYNLSQGATGFTDNVLPLELVFYQLKLTNKGILNTWQTKNEVNIDEIRIQRSDNGIDFKTIGKAKPEQSKNYSYLDESTFDVNQNIYYRLMIVDNNGSATYSKVLSEKLNLNYQAGISIYPNPAKEGKINIQVKGLPKGICYISVYNLLGIRIKELSFYFDGTLTNKSINLDVKPGSYLLNIKSSNYNETKKISIVL